MKTWADDAGKSANLAKGRGWKIADDLPPPPASTDELIELNAAAYSAGRKVDSSVDELDQAFRATEYFSEEELAFIRAEIKRASCYIYSWYLEYGSLPASRREAEIALYRYIEGQVVQQPFGSQIVGAVQKFGQAVENADSPEEAVVNVAIVTACL